MMPFVTEELWEQFVGPANGADIAGGSGRLVRGAWPQIDAPASEASAEIDWLIDLITSVRSARSELNVPAGAHVRLLVADASADTLARIARQRPLLSRLARIEAIEPLSGEAPTLAANVVVGEATYYMPLEGVIDIDAERARLDKDIAKADKQAAGLRDRLSNEAFLAKAPADVVAKGKSELAELDERLAGLRSARARLG
jgi:valyl-tRNA synthetase